MSTIAIIDNSSLVILSSYQGSSPEQNLFGGAYGSPHATTHLLCPEEVDGNISLLTVSGSIDGEGGIYLTINEAAVLAWKQTQNKSALAEYTLTRNAQADTDIRNILATAFGQSADYTTYLMIAIYGMDVALNISGTNSQQSIDDAKSALAIYRQAFSNIQGIRNTRDAEIAAFVPPYNDISPLYPN